MAIEEGNRVRATTIHGEVFEGILYKMCLGINVENPTQATIFISEDTEGCKTFGQVCIFCSELKSISRIDT